MFNLRIIESDTLKGYMFVVCGIFGVAVILTGKGDGGIAIAISLSKFEVTGSVALNPGWKV